MGPSLAASLQVLLAALQLICLPVQFATAVHYTCTGDEVAGEVQGETGVVCAPRCQGNSYDCPSDVPDGTTAQPQCMLTDVDQVSYCGLLCELDNQCPSGSFCWRAASLEVGLCVHPLSFKEWAKQASRRKKLDVGTPAKAAKSAKGIQLKKAYEALMSLKSRYSIAPGDADVLVVEEMIAVARSASQGQGAKVSQQVVAAAPPPRQNRGGLLDPWKHDVSYLAENVGRGLPGLQREVHDVIWNIEHLDKRGVCTDMLRCVILIALVYLIGGGAYKYQATGARGLEMVPHIGFWMEYPKLVADGVAYFATLVGEFTGTASRAPMGGNSGNFQPPKQTDRDTFANFEPSL